MLFSPTDLNDKEHNAFSTTSIDLNLTIEKVNIAKENHKPAIVLLPLLPQMKLLSLFLQLVLQHVHT